MSKLAVIIVNYNTKEVLRECLQNLEKETFTDKQIFVVDNASKDGSAEMVEAEFSKFLTLIKSENKGLPHAHNLGMEAAGDPQYYLFMGTDAFPKPGCLEGMVTYLDQHPEVGAATAKLVLRSGKLDMDAHRGFPTPFTALTHMLNLDKIFKTSKVFARYFMGWEDLEKPHEIDLCISHFMMVRSEVFQKTGPWDEDYFVYGEDVDICYRIKQADYKIMYLPQFECLHYKGVTVGIRKESQDKTTADTATKKRMTMESTRAMELFYKKHFEKLYPKVLTELVMLGIKFKTYLRLRKFK